MKNNAWRLVAILLLAYNTGLAAIWQGDDVTYPNDWQTAANWDTNPNIPGVGGWVGTNVYFGAAASDIIDVNGTSVSVGSFSIAQYAQTFTNSGAAATITCTGLSMGRHNQNDYNHKFYPNVDINGTFSQGAKNYGLTFYGSLEVDTLDGHLVGPITTYGPFTINDPDPIIVTPGVYYTWGGGPGYNLYNVMNCNAGMTLASPYMGVSGYINAYATNSLGGITGPLNVTTNCMLALRTAQTNYPSGNIEIGPYALLGGNMGTATWGSGNNINVQTNAILAIGAGTEPTISEIGADAVWKAHTNNTAATTTAGASGTTIYKGISIGNYSYQGTHYINGSTFISPAGAGDLELLVLAGLIWNTGNNFSAESVDQTGVANIHCRSQFYSKGFRINATTNANSCRTFNWIGESGSSAATIADFDYGAWNVYASQTYNFSGDGLVLGEVKNIEGQLTFSNVTFQSKTTQSINITKYAGTKLTFNGGSALLIGTSQTNLLESLDANQVVVNGTPYLVLANETGAYPITAAGNPRLYNFMTNSHVCIYNGPFGDKSQYLQGDGIALGDGKYLLSRNDSATKTLYAAVGHDAKIRGVGGAGTSMGIAVETGRSLVLYIPIDGNGADLKLNSVTAMTLDGGYSGTVYVGRKTQVPQGTITLNCAITNVPAIYFAGTVNVNTNVTVARIGGVGTVNYATNLTYTTVAPGFTNGCGNLNLGKFTVPVGATYEWSLANTNAAAGTGYDQIDGTTVTFNGAWTLSITDAGFTNTLTGSEVFTIIDGTSITNIGTPTVIAPNTGYKVSGATVYLENNDVKLTGVTGTAIAPPKGTLISFQ